MNKQNTYRTHTYKGVEIKTIEAPVIDSEKSFFGYQIESMFVFGCVCYTTENDALSRAKNVIDNPNLTKGMMSGKHFLPKESWFR